MGLLAGLALTGANLALLVAFRRLLSSRSSTRLAADRNANGSLLRLSGWTA
jgi:hypothetical protein